MIRTKITEMFGVKHPIICGAMMWLAEPNLCAAISNAGGLGNLTAQMYESEKLFREALDQVRQKTDKPFLVNVTSLPSGRITSEHYAMYFRVCAQEKVPGMEISGMPVEKITGEEGLAMLKEAGVRLFQKCGAVRHALHAQKMGYAGVYAAGFEEGGHPLSDDVCTMVLTPRMVESLSIPVVSAGGISNGRNLAAALVLGAEGVMMATRFVATQECRVHKNIKQELVRRQEHHTTLITKSLGLQGRALKNATVAQILEVEARGGGLQELMPLITGLRGRQAWETGDVEAAAMYFGQSTGLIHDIPTCAELLERMVEEAAQRIDLVRGLTH
ncbi:MAG: nitronate monooxygenase [Thermodesulfobacteriota bacterium]